MDSQNSFIFDYEWCTLAVLTGLCEIILWVLIVLERKRKTEMAAIN